MVLLLLLVLLVLVPTAAAADPFSAILASIGASIASAAPVIGAGIAAAAPTVATVTSTALGVASALGAFAPDVPGFKKPTTGNASEERVRRQANITPTLLAGETGLQDTPVLTDTLLGPNSPRPSA